MSSIALGLQPSFYWPGSGGGSAASAGEAQPGNLRMAHSGNVTGGFENGFLSLRTEWGSVWHIGSDWTGMVAHSGMLDRDGGGSFPQTWRWLVQEGSYNTTLSSYTHSIVFPIPYSVAPVSIQLTTQVLGPLPGTALAIVAGSVTAGGFSSFHSELAGQSGITQHWRSTGTINV